MIFRYLGHSCFTVKIGGQTLLFDPFISPNELAKDIINVDEVEADYILISHGHIDHIADAVSIALRTGATVVSSWEIYDWLGKQGVKNCHPMNTGGKWNFGAFMVQCVVAQHSSGLPDGSYGGNPMGFVVSNDDEAFYYSGDTALTMDMQLIPMLCPPLKVAIFPIGDNFTMDAKQAVIAADFVKCPNVIGVHFDTFGFIKIDHEATRSYFLENHKILNLPHIGEQISL